MTLPLLLEPEQLEQALPEADILLIDMCGQESYVTAHIPGAVSLNYADIVASQPPVNGLLPSPEDFSRVLASIGYTGKQHIVAYDREGGGHACRLLWTLEAFGISQFSLLDGGLISWASERKTLEQHINIAKPSTYQAQYSGSNVADADHILSHLHSNGIALLDARTEAEFSGNDKRSARGGHIPGAQLLDWKMCMDETRAYRLKPAETLKAMLNERGITPDKQVIAYCQSHHRSSLSCIMLKVLGYPNVLGYPGAWSDWGNRMDTPVEH